MIWVGTCRWDLKSRPIFIPNFAEKWDPFYNGATNFNQNLLKMSHYFPIFKQILEILNWAYFHANLRKFWKYDPCLYQFLHWIRGHCYTRRLILRPISEARPRIDLCTKNPPPPPPGPTIVHQGDGSTVHVITQFVKYPPGKKSSELGLKLDWLCSSFTMCVCVCVWVPVWVNEWNCNSSLYTCI